MRYWNVQAAAKDLAAGEISELGKAKYLIAGTILSIILTVLPQWIFVYTINTAIIVGYIISLFIVVVGIIQLYKINERIGATNFIERYVIFTLPAFIKVTTLYWIIYFIFIMFFAALRYENSSLRVFIGVISTPLYYLAFFWVMSHGFKAYIAYEGMDK
jgi:hypothetical protein